MFCIKCGYEIIDDAAFCESCGAPTSDEALVAQESVSETPTPSATHVTETSAEATTTGAEAPTMAAELYEAPTQPVQLENQVQDFAAQPEQQLNMDGLDVMTLGAPESPLEEVPEEEQEQKKKTRAPLIAVGICTLALAVVGVVGFVLMGDSMPAVATSMVLDEEHVPNAAFRELLSGLYDIDDNGELDRDELSAIKNLNFNEDAERLAALREAQQEDANNDSENNTGGSNTSGSNGSNSGGNTSGSNTSGSNGSNTGGSNGGGNNTGGTTSGSGNEGSNTGGSNTSGSNGGSNGSDVNTTEKNPFVLDLTPFVNLESVVANNAGIEGVIASSNSALTHMDFANNNISDIQLPQNSSLNYLNIQNNSLSSLDLSSSNKLTYADVTGNSITELDVSNNALITNLRCDEAVALAGLESNGNVEEQQIISSVDIATRDSLINIAMSYDSQGRPSGYVYNRDGVETVAVFTYDDAGRLSVMTEGKATTTYSYDENGNLAYMSMTSGDYFIEGTFTYSEEGQLAGFLQNEVTADSTNQTNNSYEYDSSGKMILATTVRPDGSTYEQFFTYNEEGQLVKEGNFAGAVNAMAYDAQGLCTQVYTLYADGSTEVEVSAFNEQGLPTGGAIGANDTTLSTIAFEMSGQDSITKILLKPEGEDGIYRETALSYGKQVVAKTEADTRFVPRYEIACLGLGTHLYDAWCNPFFATDSYFGSSFALAAYLPEHVVFEEAGALISPLETPAEREKRMSEASGKESTEISILEDPVEETRKVEEVEEPEKEIIPLTTGTYYRLGNGSSEQAAYRLVVKSTSWTFSSAKKINTSTSSGWKVTNLSELAKGSIDETVVFTDSATEDTYEILMLDSKTFTVVCTSETPSAIAKTVEGTYTSDTNVLLEEYEAR